MTERKASTTRSVTIEYGPTEEELVSVVRLQLLQLSRIRRVGVVGLATVAAGVLFLAIPSRSNIIFGGFLIGVGLYSLLVTCSLYFTPVRLVRKMGADVPKVYESRILEFSDEGVWVRSDDIDSFTQWADYSRALEKEGLYLLRRNQRGAYTLAPKRTFRSDSDELLFRALVADHMSACLDGAVSG